MNRTREKKFYKNLNQKKIFSKQSQVIYKGFPKKSYEKKKKPLKLIYLKQAFYLFRELINTKKKTLRLHTSLNRKTFTFLKYQTENKKTIRLFRLFKTWIAYLIRRNWYIFKRTRKKWKNMRVHNLINNNKFIDVHGQRSKLLVFKKSKRKFFWTYLKVKRKRKFLSKFKKRWFWNVGRRFSYKNVWIKRKLNNLNYRTNRKNWKEKKTWILWKSTTKTNQRFARTTLGKHFINAHIQKAKKVFGHPDFIKRWRWLFLYSTKKQLKLCHKLGWYYNNIIWSNKLNTSEFKKFKYKYPYSILEPYWLQYTNFRWLGELQSKRLVYNALFPTQRNYRRRLQSFVSIPYLRNKKPFWQKKNKIYRYYQQFIKEEPAKRNKLQYMKIVLTKTLLSFYGRLKLKQFVSIYKKNKKKKTQNVWQENNLIGAVEQRLDVAIYRLNIAPTIYWARKLIEDGLIFVSSPADQRVWENMHNTYKSYIFPLALKDPKNLYKHIKLSYRKSLKAASLQLFTEPIRRKNYLIKPGEIIYCAPGSNLNHFKVHSICWIKPIPDWFQSYSILNETTKDWTKTKRKHRKKRFISSKGKTTSETIIGQLLTTPSFESLHKHDRSQHSYFYWLYL